MYLGEYRIDDYVTLIATTHRFSSGAAYAPTAITYRVYDDATAIEIVADTAMTNFDTETGFYLDRIQCTAVLGYEVGKTYTALIKATVDSVAAITAYTWRILTPPVNVAQWLGTACATPTVNGVPEVDLTHVAGATTNVSTLATNVDAILTDTADMQPKLGTPAGASISADILVIDNFVDGLETTIGVAGAGLTDLGGMSTTMKGQVQTEAEDALGTHRLEELLNADSDIDGLAPPTVGSVFHEALSKTAGSFTYDQTTDSLEAIRDKETDIETDTAEIGAAGAGLTNINLPDQTMNITGNITGNLSGSVGSVTGAVGSVTGAVGSVAGNVDGNVTGSVGGLTAAALKDFFDTDSATTYA